MPTGTNGGLLLPVGQALVTTASASQRDLVEILARARSVDLCGLLSIQTPSWHGHILLVDGVPLYAIATRAELETPLLDRDAYEQLCLSFGAETAGQVHLYRLDPRVTRALPGLFQRCALVRRLSSASELRFLLEIVGGCHFDGCLQIRAGDDQAIVLIHQGRPLGSYTAESRQVHTSLAGPLAAILSKPSPEVAFFPNPQREPAPLPSIEPPRPTPAAAPAPTARPAQLLPTPVPAPARPPAPAPVLAPPWPHAPAATAAPAAQLARPPSAHPHAGHAPAAHGPKDPTHPPATPASPALSPPIAAGPRPSGNDDLAESQMLWLLTALDRQWSQLKEKDLADPAMLVSLAGMTSLCLAKVEAVRTGSLDVAADPATVEDVVARVRSRFPAASTLRAHGSRVDATPLVAAFRTLNGRAAEQAWLCSCADALLAGLRIALSRLVEQCESELTREEMQQTCDVYLADVEADLQALRDGALAVAGY